MPGFERLRTCRETRRTRPGFPDPVDNMAALVSALPRAKAAARKSIELGGQVP